eukprot:COSAG01_NODE_68_length_28978_cov_182.027777_1_plen_80_part_00
MLLDCACRGSRLVRVLSCNEPEPLVNNNTTTLDTPPILSLHWVPSIFGTVKKKADCLLDRRTLLDRRDRQSTNLQDRWI